MKAAIVTIYDLMNYGNRLQNYATMSFLKSINIESDTLVLDYKTVPSIVKDAIKKAIGKPIYKSWNELQEDENYIKDFSTSERKKYEKFKEFSYEYTNIKHKKYLRLPNSNMGRQYDIFIAGSDQIWNPNIGQAQPWEFLDFAPRGKKISWAASFGVDQIQPEQESWIRQRLNEMDYISVREKAGEEIVRHLTQKEATTIVDPTLLIDVKEWESLSAKPEALNGDTNYMLVFFLGGVSTFARNKINEISKENELDVVDLLDENCEMFESGPREFLYLISHAKIVLTDSFHASVFSFLFQRPFLVFQREKEKNITLSRIKTLLGTFHLERKMVTNRINDDIFECDYSEGFDILKDEREKAAYFLSTAIEKIQEGKQ